MKPEYRWEAVAVCAQGAVLARLPIYPGRLGLLQDLGCGLDYVDIDGRTARFRPVLTPRLTTQRISLWHVPLEWPTGWRGFGLCGAQGCIASVLPVVEVPYPKSEITVS